MTEEQKQPQPAASVPAALTPETIASALAILGEVAKTFAAPTDPQPQAVPSPQPVAAEKLGEYAGQVFTTLTASPIEREPLLTSSRFWTMIGTVATLAVQHPIGFELSPITQVCIAGVAGIYIAARTIKGGRRIEA